MFMLRHKHSTIYVECLCRKIILCNHANTAAYLKDKRDYLPASDSGSRGFTVGWSRQKFISSSPLCINLSHRPVTPYSVYTHWQCALNIRSTQLTKKTSDIWVEVKIYGNKLKVGHLSKGMQWHFFHFKELIEKREANSSGNFITAKMSASQ